MNDCQKQTVSKRKVNILIIYLVDMLDVTA